MSKVLILMSTYNGEKYLREQIDSIKKQSLKSIDVLVRDDGSKDDTIKILEEYRCAKMLKWYTGENLKPAKSFMNLVYNCDDSYDYYAFCDQDDYWKENKIEEAIKKLNDKVGPAMYYCSTDNVNSYLQHIDYSFRNHLAASSLLSSIKCGSLIPGCTMVFNRDLLKYLRTYKPIYIGMHDNWVHLVCLAVHGTVEADESSLILYRQHENNAVGSQKKNLKYRFNRFFGNPNIYSNIARELYLGYSSYMTLQECTFLEQNVNYRTSIKKTLMCLKDNDFDGIPIKDRFLYKLKILFRVY